MDVLPGALGGDRLQRRDEGWAGEVPDALVGVAGLADDLSEPAAVLQGQLDLDRDLALGGGEDGVGQVVASAAELGEAAGDRALAFPFPQAELVLEQQPDLS